MSYPGSKKAKLPPSRADLGHLGDILRRPRFWMLGMAMFFAGAGEFAFAYWGASYIQLHFNTLPRAGAFGAAAFALGMAAGRIIAGKLANRYGLKKMVIATASAGAVFSLSFFIIKSPLVIYGYLFIVGLLVACHWPSIQAYSAQVMDVDPTALMVFLSCFGIPGTSTAIIVMGIIGDAYSLHTAYVVAPVFILMIAVFMFLEGRVEREK
jgi:fucose permease